MGRALGKNRIIQFGIPRSGSTLVYNVLREAFPARHIKKTHSLNAKLLKHPIIATYRHPLDVMASILQCQALEASDAEIRKQLIILNRTGLWDILSIRDQPGVLLLRYEDFFGDFDFLFNAIEAFLNLPITAEMREHLRNTYNIQNVKSRIGEDADFSQYDKTTQLHGRHISKFDGQSGYHKEFFSPKQAAYLKRHLSFFIEEMGY